MRQEFVKVRIDFDIPKIGDPPIYSILIFPGNINRHILVLAGTCGWNNFICSNLECLPFALTCDGNDNCGDGSDENNTQCYTTGIVKSI